MLRMHDLPLRACATATLSRHLHIPLMLPNAAERMRASSSHLTPAGAAIAALRAQLDRLEEEKADITLVTQYTGQASVQASVPQLMVYLARAGATAPAVCR